MGKKLTTYVHADGKVYKPGDDVPKSVTNPKTWGGDASSAQAETGTEDVYADAKVPDLKAEIARRNEGRAPDDQLVSSGNKAALVAVLVADDEAAAAVEADPDA